MLFLSRKQGVVLILLYILKIGFVIKNHCVTKSECNINLSIYIILTHVHSFSISSLKVYIQQEKWKSHDHTNKTFFDTYFDD